ncbi:MAG: potassium-transporting ATPase subunit KdpC [Bacteroidales bacterium]|nr:potassium-transporting ATPase subunit KdpC [Bacteroidales bacterium]
MRTQFFIALKLFFSMTLLTGVIYPLVVTGIAQGFFAKEANGSLITKENVVIGSELIGQAFDTAIYFNSRPSASGYSSMPSGASNLSVTSEKLKRQIIERKSLFLMNNRLPQSVVVPSDMLFASGSGLDPHISVSAAKLQINRIATARHLTSDEGVQLTQCVDQMVESRQWFLLGEPRVNVLLLNLMIDNRFKSKK